MDRLLGQLREGPIVVQVTTELMFEVAVLGELLPALAEHVGPGATFNSEWPPPPRPGVYVWVRPGDNAVAYIGSAASLAGRVRWEPDDSSSGLVSAAVGAHAASVVLIRLLTFVAA